mgnify:CR=1 FL=1
MNVRLPYGAKRIGVRSDDDDEPADDAYCPHPGNGSVVQLTDDEDPDADFYPQYPIGFLGRFKEVAEERARIDTKLADAVAEPPSFWDTLLYRLTGR